MGLRSICGRAAACLLMMLLLLSQPVSAEGAPVNTSEGRGTRLAVDPFRNSEGFSTVLYDNMNGLPTSEANAIAETEEGFLWIGGYSGLIRYDGNTFERMDPSSGIPNARALHVDAAGRLWVATNDNGVAMIDRGEICHWDKSDGIRSNCARAVAEDGDGTIYVATTDGIVVFGEDLTPRMLDDPRLADPFVHDLRRGSDGAVYGLTTSSDLLVLRDGALVSYWTHEGNGLQGIGCILPDPERPGYLYMEVDATKLYHGKPDSGTLGEPIADISAMGGVQQFEYIDGRLWICGRKGVGVFDGDGFQKLENIPLNNSVGGMLLDYEGDLWFTSTRQGVMKLVPNPFFDIFERSGLAEAVVNSTCLIDGQLFVGTDVGLTVIGADGAVLPSMPLTRAETASGVPLEATDLLELLDGVRIRSVIRDSRGRAWISTWRSMGLLCCDHGELTVFTEEDGLFSDCIRAVYEREDGTLLVALTGGVNVIEDGRVTGGYGVGEGVENIETLTVAEGFHGDIVVGSDGGGICVIRPDGTVRHIGTAEGMSSEIVMRVKRDRTRDILWLVTGNSLSYLNEDYEVRVLHTFPYSNNFDLYENSHDEIWVLSSNGIYVAPAEDLLDDIEPKLVYYGIANGLPCIATGNSYSELTEDGMLYIAGSTGVTRVDIEAPLADASKLKAAVPFIDADGERIYPDASGGYTVGSGVQKLTVHSFVYNYSLIDPQVSWWLEGFDRISTSARRSELGPVSYTNLPGGTYRFTMLVMDPMGYDWSECSVQIVKEKAFYEQAWFFATAALLTAAGLAAAVWAYVRRKIRLLEEKHREEAEKERIGAELQMAGQIQGGMLPHRFPPFPERKEFDIYALMDPAKEVGGDFYDFFMADDDHLALVVADVSGKGVPAALFSMIAKTMLKTQTHAHLSPAQVLDRVNALLSEDNTEDLFVTVWLGVLELSTGVLTYADGGHEKLLICTDGEWRFLPKGGGVALAMYEPEDFEFLEERFHFHDRTVHLHPGDALFQYSDGVTEATDADNELFGDDRLLDAVRSAPSTEPTELLSHVRAAIDAFVRDAPQFDDITMLGVRMNAVSSAPRNASAPSGGGER